LFDQLACGESKHPAEEYDAYSASELLMDLETICRSILDNVEDAQKLKNMPTLVIHGKEDMIFPIDVGDHLNQSLSDSEFCIIPDASHQVFEEKYEEVAEVMWKCICSHM